ncbi:MAG: hypothetical protein GY708_06450 [Actinomycetia bacterium]|nr:hypothetical protein [Actinomycetes bacterium]MCP4961946.1 hypothetical protein [Actinomycetes bacterium]
MKRHVAATVLVVAFVVGCTGDDSLPPAVLITTNPTGPISSPTTTDVGASSGAPGSTVSTTDGVQRSVETLEAEAVFGPVDQYDPALSLVRLAPVDVERLEEGLRSDERVDPHLLGVAARGVMRSDELVAIALSIAVDPEMAVAAGFEETFLEGATGGGVASPLPVVIEGAELTAWITEDTSSVVWVHENVYLVVSGRDVDEVTRSVETMVSAALGLTVAGDESFSETTTSTS